MDKRIEEKFENIEAEQEEKALLEAKKNNLVYFGIPECEDESPEAKIEHDREQFITTNNEEEANFDDNIITDMFRVGKKGAKPRPIIVKFQDYKTKNRYLKNSANLKEVNGEKIYVNPDFTPKQREERKNLVKEMNRRRDNGEKNLVIRNNKIVEKQNFQRDSPPKKVNWKNHVLKKGE